MERMKLAVLLKDEETERQVTINNAARVSWDREAAKRKWPSAKDGPFFWMTYLAWFQLKAQGDVACTFDEFANELCLDIESEGTDDVDPTPSTQEPGLP